jgi:hypothetical protein
MTTVNIRSTTPKGTIVGAMTIVARQSSKPKTMPHFLFDQMAYPEIIRDIPKIPLINAQKTD